MPTRAEIEEQARVQEDVVALAFAALLTVWDELNPQEPAAAADQLAPVFVEAVQTYGELSASLAADFYETLRETAGVPGDYTAALADAVPSEQAEASARWAIRPLFERTGTDENGEQVTEPADPDKALARLQQSMQRHVRQPGRETVAHSADRDPAGARWARVPTGAETCAFCRIMAGRGAVYGSEGAAGADQDVRFVGEGRHKYHDFCDCVATPIWSEADFPEGYDPDAFEQQYIDARAASTGADIRNVTAAMREQLGVR